MLSTKVILLLLAVAGILGIAIGYFARLIISLGKKGSMELEIKQMMLEAQVSAKKITEESEKRAEEKAREISIELKERERELKVVEERLVRKEELLDKRQTNLETEQESLVRKVEDVQQLRERAEALG